MHQLLFAGGRPGVEAVWAAAQGPVDVGAADDGQLDLLGPPDDAGGNADEPVRPDGYLRPEWVGGGWSHARARLAPWAASAVACAGRRRELLAAGDVGCPSTESGPSRS